MTRTFALLAAGAFMFVTAAPVLAQSTTTAPATKTEEKVEKAEKKADKAEKKADKAEKKADKAEKKAANPCAAKTEKK